MHPRYQRADELTGVVIGACIEVHRLKGPGLLESIYQRCLQRELSLRGIPFCRELVCPIEYKGEIFEDIVRLDFLLDGCLVLELKAVERVLPVHKAQVMSYMKLMDAPLGLVVNFHESILKNGISRMILPGADRHQET